MSSYFDALSRAVADAAAAIPDDGEFVARVAALEAGLFTDLIVTTGNAAFPAELGGDMLYLFATRAMYRPGGDAPPAWLVARMLRTRRSLVIDGLHSAHHDLARLRAPHPAGGTWTDNPGGDAARLTTFER